jgi:hypothetical protein
VDHSSVNNICECARQDAGRKWLWSPVVDVVQWTIPVSSTITCITDTRMVHCTTSTTCDHNHFPSASCRARSRILLTLEWSTVQRPQHATTITFRQHRVKHTHMYYLHSNGPLYNIHNMRPQPLSVGIVSSTLTCNTYTRMVHCTTLATHNNKRPQLFSISIVLGILTS